MTKNLSRIAIVIPNLCGGGAERVYINLANDWAQKGFLVEFVVLNQTGELTKLLDSNIKVTSLNVSRIRRVIFPLSRHLKLTCPQIVIAAMWPLTSAVVLAWFLYGRKCKLFLSDHENLTLSYIGQGRVSAIYLKSIIRFTYPLVNGVIAVSEGVKNDLCELGNLSKDIVRVINNPAAIGVSSIRDLPVLKARLWGVGFDYHILAVGRLAPEKDYVTMINAFAHLSKNINAKLIILGEGSLRPMLEDLVSALRLDGRVVLPGFVIDPYPWYRSADLFVLSSIWEGFGNVIVEALECGLPIVSTKCPSGPEEILENGLYGTLVPIQDSYELSLAMRDSLRSSHDRIALRRRAQDFSLRKISEEYLAYIC